MVVRIKKNTNPISWYRDMIGSLYEVKDNYTEAFGVGECYTVVSDDLKWPDCGIYVNDCEIVKSVVKESSIKDWSIKEVQEFLSREIKQADLEWKLESVLRSVLFGTSDKETPSIIDYEKVKESIIKNYPEIK